MHERKEKLVNPSGRLLARNAILNFIGQAIPLVVGVITIPFIVRGLGTERFGLLSLAWVVLGYFSVFDLGLGRATTKFVAEALGKGEADQVPRLVWTAVTVQAVLGIVGALVLTGITPLLVERILKVPSDLFGEAKTTLRLLALSIPVVLISGSFRGVLEASQRFDLVNAVNIPTSVLTFILPLVGLLFGMNLPGIVTLILLARVWASSSFLVLNLRLMPKLKRYSSSLSLFPRLLSFGGWIAVSSIVAPFLENLDRFIIGFLLSMTAVAHYSAPQEVVMRLRVIVTSLTMTLFPAFSVLEVIRDKKGIEAIFLRSIKYILLILGIIILFINVFAKCILQIWLGTDFALASSSVLQILSLGVLFNSLGYIPATLLQGVARPDLPAKFLLLEVPIRIGTAYVLVKKYNIIGAAWSWTLWAVLDMFLLFVVSVIIYGFSMHAFFSRGIMWTFCFIVVLWWALYELKEWIVLFPQSIQFLISAVILCSFAAFTWRYALDNVDRIKVLKLIKLCRNWRVRD